VPTSARCIDLGSGAGVPGLPLALAHPGTTWILVDAWARRVDLLRQAIQELGLEDRVVAVHARAEELARTDERGSADLVTARSFGPPSRTAECAAPLLAMGGWLVVSSSPSGDEWPDDLSMLGLGLARRWRIAAGGYLGYRRVAEVPDRFPRRPAAQARTPLF
jgi:16S rRNA (guanine527-N7)-methyltransferase